MSRSYGVVWNSRVTCQRWLAYSRRGNFGISTVQSIRFMYSPDGTNVYMIQGGYTEYRRDYRTEGRMN